MAIFYNNFRNNSKNILFFAHLFVPLHPQNFKLQKQEAQMAESVDALVSNTSGATHPGSSPGLGTRLESEVL